MRLVITGGTGNVGTALLQRLRDAEGVRGIHGVVAGPPPEPVAPYDRAQWSRADIGDSGSVPQLAELCRGATAVVHLAWDILGTGGRAAQQRTNVAGTRHVLAAALAAGVPHLVHISSVAAYTPEPRHLLRVGEDWPRTGLPGSWYSRDKVTVEQLLDRAGAHHPGLHVNVLRPPSILQPAAATELTNYLLGRLAPLVRHRWLRPAVLPLPGWLTAQVVHAADVAELLWRVLRERPPGAYNVAADRVLTASELAGALGSRWAPLPGQALRMAMELSAAARLQPLNGSWFDLLARAPLVSTDRARTELGWRPAHPAAGTLTAVRDAAVAGTGTGSPRLAPAA